MPKQIIWNVCLLFVILFSQALSAQLPPAPGTLLEGIVKDRRSGAAVEGVRVSAAAQSGLAINRETNVAGKFSFDKLAAGEYTLQFSKAGYIATSQAFSVGGIVGERIGNLTITLVPTGALEGEVLDDSGKPVAK